MLETPIPDTDVTSEDHTPYAQSLTAGKPARWSMCRWVLGAGRQRLTHLALSRPSRASRRFAAVNLFLLSFAMALAVFANTGWRVVECGPGVRDPRTQPQSAGWWLAAQSPAAQNPASLTRLTPVAAWWSVPIAAITAGITFVAAGLVNLLLLVFVAAGSARALRGQQLGNKRLKCAIHYSTAWILPMLVALLPAVLRPLAHLSAVNEWNAFRSQTAFDAPAVLITVVCVLLWWFWLIRLANTVPVESRRFAVRYFMIWTPMLAVVVLGSLAVGIYVLSTRLGSAEGLAW